MLSDNYEPPKPHRKPRSKQSLYAGYMMDTMLRLEWAMHDEIARHQVVPSEWARIFYERPERKKKRITIGIDEDVLRFFKSMGTGYQGRINDTLRAFMFARLAGYLEAFEAPPEYRREKPPQWGDVQRGWEKRLGQE